jgi:FemAB-related protein (PEP-CTERM system-associated)
VLPLTHVKSLLFGSSLISNAFCIHGGIVSADGEVQDCLRAEAIRMAREMTVGWIEFRSALASPPPWQSRSGLYFIFRRPIAPDAETNLKMIPHTRRRMVRVALDNGLRSEIDGNVDRLHHVYAESVRHLGTPVFSRRYFRLLQERFGSSCEVLTVLHEQRPVASVMSFYFRDEVMTYYGGGLREARNLAGNDFMYWEVMRHACARGARIFDFGRSKIGTGAYNFKCNWGFKPAPLTYEYLPVTAREIPDVNPLNPKYGLAINLWRRLPLSLTKLVGPMIVRSIG